MIGHENELEREEASEDDLDAGETPIAYKKAVANTDSNNTSVGKKNSTCSTMSNTSTLSTSTASTTLNHSMVPSPSSLLPSQASQSARQNHLDLSVNSQTTQQRRSICLPVSESLLESDQLTSLSNKRLSLQATPSTLSKNQSEPSGIMSRVNSSTQFCSSLKRYSAPNFSAPSSQQFSGTLKSTSEYEPYGYEDYDDEEEEELDEDGGKNYAEVDFDADDDNKSSVSTSCSTGSSGSRCSAHSSLVLHIHENDQEKWNDADDQTCLTKSNRKSKRKKRKLEMSDVDVEAILNKKRNSETTTVSELSSTRGRSRSKLSDAEMKPVSKDRQRVKRMSGGLTIERMMNEILTSQLMLTRRVERMHQAFFSMAERLKSKSIITALNVK